MNNKPEPISVEMEDDGNFCAVTIRYQAREYHYEHVPVKPSRFWSRGFQAVVPSANEVGEDITVHFALGDD